MMPGKMSDPNTMPKRIMKSEHDVGEPETKEGIESGHDAEEHEIKRRDRIWSRCQRT